MKKEPDRRVIYWVLFYLIFIAASLGIISQLFIASQMHLSGDDYCYNAILARDGVWKMQWTSYTEVSMYNGNRYALNLYSGLFGVFPVWGASILIFVSVGIWLLGATGVTLGVSQQIGWKIKKIEAFLFSMVILNFILVSAPDLQQSLFWRSGMLPYFMPLVGIVLMGWLGLIMQRHPGKLWVGLFLEFVLALLFSGFSESGTALLIGLWGVGFLVSIFYYFRDHSKGRYWLVMTGIGLLGSLIGLALLYFSPSTALRRVNMPDPIGFMALIKLLFFNLKVFFWQALMRKTLYLALPVAFGLGLGFLLPKLPLSESKRRAWLRFISVGLVIGVATIFLIALIYLPATYIFADYPPQRALILAQFVMVVAEVSGGIWLSVPLRELAINLSTREKAREKIMGLLSLVLIGASIISPIKLIKHTISEAPKVMRWSQLWVKRHEELLQAGLENSEEIHVIQLDRVINDVGELSPDSGYWYNNCAEMYYGIDAIFADQSGW